MRNIYSCKILKKPFFILLENKRKSYLIWLVLGLFTCQNAMAQFVNQSNLKVSDDVIMAIYMDYKNSTSGNFVNNGQVYFFRNWINDGKVSYDNSSAGTTFFSGQTDQIIEGASVSNFQNLVFDNLGSVIPFQLKTTITIGDNLDFKNGIINARDYNGIVVFNKNATYSNASDESFIDGEVEKKGTSLFEFPVGNELYFRPSFYESTSENYTYTCQYFYQNSAILHSHKIKEENIISINNKEYWKVTKGDDYQNIVLSLTLDSRTTPAIFFDINSNTEIIIVRWDEKNNKWVKEGGVVSDPLVDENYSKILTAEVQGEGIFTMAIVNKAPPEPDNLIVYNALSPNGDGINDTFHIKGIDKYPDNTVEIYNRWGVKVYGTKSYNESDNMFTGYSDGRATIKRNDLLPTGTYFYILKYNNGIKEKQQTGYLYINNQ